MKIDRMFVVGCGGIGSHFIPNLAVLTDRKIPLTLIDGDRYKPSNSARQPLVYMGYTNENKAYAMQQFLYIAMKVGHVSAVDRYIHDDEDFASMLVRDTSSRGQDYATLLCLCVDNDATRRIIYDGVRMQKSSVVVVDMANERNNGDVIMWGWIGGEDVGIFPPLLYPNIKEPKDRPPGASCQQELSTGDTQILTTNMMAACIGLEIVRRIINDEAVCLQMMFDFNAKGQNFAWRV